MNSKLLEVGSKIKIERSDGRIHPAVITDVNFELNVVSVEWFEAGETKGKDIDIVHVLQLNPDTYTRPPKPLGPGSKARQSVATVMASTSSTARANKIINRPKLNGPKSVKSRVFNNTIDKFPQTTRLSQNPRCSESSVLVRRMGKLETDRLERRRKNDEIKVEKTLISRKMANNPNWELQRMISEYCQDLKFKPLTYRDTVEDRLITVCVRKRPLNKQELLKKEVDIITVPSKDQLIVHEPKNKVDLTKYLNNHMFKFDYTFNEDCSNETIYKYTAQPLIRNIFNGGSATCFAYGQTGSGKTFTMTGELNKSDENRGIYELTATDIFRFLNLPQHRHSNFLVSCSFFEIYSGKILDLLNSKANLKLLEDGKQQVQVIGLTEKVVRSELEVLDLIRRGNAARSSGQTSVNINSSRSHAIFQIYLRQSKKTLNNSNSLHGKFSLIDLAGNERGADTISAGKVTRREGGEINKSLLALKECIRALGRKSMHLPFRGSKLTQVLRDSFIGSNSPICMIAMVSPGTHSCENTLNTLRYADRVKELDGGDLSQLHTNMEIDHDESDCNDRNDDSIMQEQIHNGDELKMIKEKVTNCHRQLVEKLSETDDDAKYLLSITGSEIYEQEMYCTNLEEVVDNLVSFLMSTKECLLEYKEQLNKSNAI